MKFMSRNGLVAREVATVIYNWKTILPVHRYCSDITASSPWSALHGDCVSRLFHFLFNFLARLVSVQGRI